MKRKGFWADPVAMDVARQVADIAGPSSAFARALEEFDRRTAAGEDLILVKANGSILIVPTADVIDSIVPATGEAR